MIGVLLQCAEYFGDPMGDLGKKKAIKLLKKQ